MTKLVLLIICAVSLPILVTGQCTPDPCRNGGICEIGYKGKGYRCKCPNSDSLNYGLKCEILNIGFYASEEGRDIRAAFTPTIGFIGSPNIVSVSFEFIGRCSKESESHCHVLSLKSPNDVEPLLAVWMHKSGSNKTEYKWIVELAHPTNFTIGPLTGRINTDKWMRLHIYLDKKIFSADIGTLYPSKNDQLIIFSNFWPANQTIQFDKYENSTLLLGGFYGCVRIVALNRKLVDLGSFTLHRDSVPINKSEYKKYASHFCYPTEKSCHSSTSHLGDRIFDSNSRTKCGANSKCDGVLDSDMECSCRCDIGKRSRLETLINRDRCWKNLTEQDECIEDTTTVSTGQSDFQLKWEASNSKCLNISAHDFSIEFMVLTSQVNVTSMLEVKDLFTIKIFKGYLQLCIHGKQNCERFLSFLVSDDVWHEVSFAKRLNQFFIAIDSSRRFFSNKSNETFKLDSICQFKIMLPNSCIRGLRISGVTMPVRETDQVNDYSGNPIIFHKGSSVSVNDHCNFDKTGLIPPTCDPPCPDGEECDGSVSGSPECFCKKLFD